jgi:virulence-associated protein VagC
MLRLCSNLDPWEGSVATTKVFKSGGSQADRIPGDFRLGTDTVSLERTASGLVISAVSAARKGAARRPVKAAAPVRQLGFLKGLKVPQDFDAPLPESLLRAFGKV